MYRKLTAPEYNGLIVKTTPPPEVANFIYLNDGWVPFDMLEFNYEDGMFFGEYKYMEDDVAVEEMAKHSKQVNNLLKRAKKLSEEYHKGQKDLGGHPYSEHINAVVNGVNTKEEKIIAYLHDIVEDTNCKLSDLRRRRFPDWVVNHVDILTREKDEDYFDYIERIKNYTFAKNIKLADLNNNLDESRLKKVTEDDKKRLAKYRKAKRMLSK